MRTYKGIVCEKKKKYMIFLTSEGEFLRGIPIGKTPDIGDETNFQLVPFREKAKFRFIGPAIAAAMLLLFISATLFTKNNQVMAYVQLETDTAVELEVNRNGKVIAVRDLKETTESNYYLTKWKGQKLEAVLDSIIKDTITRDSNKQVMITTVFSDSKNAGKVQEIVGDAVHNVRGEYEEFDWRISKSTEKERKTANEQKISIHELKKMNEEVPAKGKNLPSTINDSQKVVPTVPANEKENEGQFNKDSGPSAPPAQKNNEKLDQGENRGEQKREEQLENRELKPKPAPVKESQRDSNASNKNRGKVNENPSSKQKEKNSDSQKKNDSPSENNKGK
ncbi:anti-sigma factor domain-containing protein [Sporosarcina ureilytica]|uniref:RsgI N-terminal anti-sigma domain-containing protein n=1 Tax=Sporosarcina ureilytica TaxID=298596 RepID=A0A1D8JC25_9BACL|nr:anti-sigma factor domain-containing protein [Sporosarcina ureilytica]AOV06255.1 hypothetical protein BI350_00445 [Sporosarcina ureilytica]